MVICMTEHISENEGTWTTCHVCKRKIFLSQSTLDTITEQGYFIEDILPHCIPCGTENMSKISIPVNLSQNQINEIRSELEKIKRDLEELR